MNHRTIPFHRPDITGAEIDAVTQVLKNGWLTTGEEARELEASMAEALGTTHAIAVSSCTAALHLALLAAGIGPGDEVVVPSITFVSTATSVVHTGARPVIVDVLPHTHSLDPAAFEAALTPRTRAVIPVHYAGLPAEMDTLTEIARGKGIAVIEDSAHALPASYKGKSVGSLGEAGAFSFYATKTVTSAEGGMVTTDNEEWAARVRALRLHGLDRDAWKRYRADGTWRYDVTEAGFKYNMPDTAAAMARVQLSRMYELTEQRARVVRAYDEAFAGEEALELFPHPADRESAYHLYPVKLNLPRITCSRDEFLEKLAVCGVHGSVHFIPLHHFTLFKEQAGNQPVSDNLFERVLSLPLYSGMTAEDVDYVIEVVRDTLKECRR